MGNCRAHRQRKSQSYNFVAIRKHPLRTIIGLCSLLLVTVVIYYARSTAVSIIVINKTQHTLHDVEVRGTFGKAAFGSISPGSKREQRITPSSDSDMVITYELEEQNVSNVVDVYVTRGYRGHVTIFVWPHRQVSWESKLCI